jgi:hypothetical protein
VNAETATAIADAFIKVAESTRGNYPEVQIAAMQALAEALRAPDTCCCEEPSDAE